MLQLRVLSGRHAGLQRICHRVPVRIGRAHDNDLQLDDEGVWPRHATIGFDPRDGFILRAEPDAMLSVNFQPAQTVRLRDGDCIQLGAATLQFRLTPLEQRPLDWLERGVWILVAAVTLAQILLLARMPV